jgi:hypothetical protein
MHKSFLVLVLIGAQWTLPLFAAEQQQTNPRANVRSPHGALARPCEDCHTHTAWTPIRNLPEFNHNDTKYPLLGMHKDVGCRQCHTNMVFTKVGMRCADCHADLHRGQFGANCEQCHTVKGWRVSINAVREHFNRFPLIGMHAVVECDACHRNAANGQFQGLSIVCYTCHQADYKTPVFDHVSTGFGTTCTDCHSMDSWLGAKFDHLKYTGFALMGVHATLDCSACHTGGRFKGTPANCYGCHQKDFTSATNPNHVQAGFPHDCGTCHSSVAWSPATFNHAALTNFPLTGAHATLQCSQCHVNNNYNLTSTACSSCHMTDYNGTKNPNHVTSGFPTDCSICHNTSAWIPARFDHGKTAFPLTGAHVTVACTSCHVNGNYTTLPVDCYSCHTANYNGTTNPNHKTVGFPTTCSVCHSTTAWNPAIFNHNTTPFPLTGAHVTVACTSCHINGNYTTTPTNCYSCHTADYTGTTNPNHVASSFPTTCATCHTTTSWLGATFNHTWFPIYSGNHAGKWTTCADCHVNPADYSAFSCITCHQHSQANTDPHHGGVRNYTYAPTSCYSCHRSGGGG